MSHARRSGALAAILAVVIAAGGGDAGSTETVTVTRTVTVEAPAPVPVVEATPTATPARTPVAEVGKRTRPAPAALRSCDRNITARIGTTSCEFAQNTFWAYWHAHQAGETTLTAYSPVTARNYDVSCRPGAVTICRAEGGAEVRFPLSAVRAYSADQADAFAATHDTGQEEAPDEEEPTAGDDCDPDYTGACLDPDSPDYDCEGGTGDGPDYTGTVEVVGEDRHDLDRDGDGVACDA